MVELFETLNLDYARCMIHSCLVGIASVLLFIVTSTARATDDGCAALAKIPKNLEVTAPLSTSAFNEWVALPDLLKYSIPQKEAYERTLRALFSGNYGNLLLADTPIEKLFGALASCGILSNIRPTEGKKLCSDMVPLIKELAALQPDNAAYGLILGEVIAGLGKKASAEAVPLVLKAISGAKFFRSPYQELTTYIFQKGFSSSKALIFVTEVSARVPVLNFTHLKLVDEWILFNKNKEQNEGILKLAKTVFEQEANLRSYKEGVLWNALDFTLSQHLGTTAWRALHPNDRDMPEYLTKRYGDYLKAYDDKSRLKEIMQIIRKEKRCDPAIVKAYLDDEKQKAIAGFQAAGFAFN